MKFRAATDTERVDNNVSATHIVGVLQTSEAPSFRSDLDFATLDSIGSPYRPYNVIISLQWYQCIDTIWRFELLQIS